jgi:hypothetical protein
MTGGWAARAENRETLPRVVLVGEFEPGQEQGLTRPRAHLSVPFIDRHRPRPYYGGPQDL